MERFLHDDDVFGLEFSSHTQTIPHKTLTHSLTHIQSDGLSYREFKIESYIYNYGDVKVYYLNKVHYNNDNKSAVDIRLDVDDRQSKGPETTTVGGIIEQNQPNGLFGTVRP